MITLIEQLPGQIAAHPVGLGLLVIAVVAGFAMLARLGRGVI